MDGLHLNLTYIYTVKFILKKVTNMVRFFYNMTTVVKFYQNDLYGQYL